MHLQLHTHIRTPILYTHLHSSVMRMQMFTNVKCIVETQAHAQKTAFTPTHTHIHTGLLALWHDCQYNLFGELIISLEESTPAP